MIEIKPAMTAEEWADGRWTIPMVFDYLGPHACAALCLDGQPFGFTREDVVFLRYIEQHHGPSAELLDLAARIEALLPPESV